MAATKIGILFSIALSKRRRVRIPDDDSELPLTPAPGEGYCEQSIADYEKLGADAAVLSFTGKAPLGATLSAREVALKVGEETLAAGLAAHSAAVLKFGQDIQARMAALTQVGLDVVQ